jgi:hypothetical protein
MTVVMSKLIYSAGNVTYCPVWMSRKIEHAAVDSEDELL